MGLSKNIKIALLEKNLKVSDLADKIGLDSNVLSVKLSRDSLSSKSLDTIADALDCDVKLVDRKTGKIF
nr:MAG TPA: SOS-response transcriptional repressor [Caudoviricetes sp.]